mmetsp:Transcript_1110/g.2483  ORF Transcript_1110/g.2483 Transcript_1110/m.2483 type:complete len:298 (-) Transcript_1110:226-1119(-)
MNQIIHDRPASSRGAVHGPCSSGVEVDTELEELLEGLGKVLEKGALVLGVLLHPGAELWVPNERQVRGQHHELARGVLVLHRALPGLGLMGLLRGPRVLEHLAIVLVGEGSLSPGPGAPVARSICVAAAEGVRAGEGDNLLVVEAHAVEDVADVLRRLLLAVVASICAGEAAIRGEALVLRGRRGLERVRPSGPEAHVGSAAGLDGDDACVHVQVSVGHARVLALDGLEEGACVVQPCVATVVALGLKAHGCAVRAARARLHVVSAGAVPGETYHHGRDGAAAAVGGAVHRGVGRRV